MEAGRIIQTALIARGHGATVVTANRQDFEIYGRRVGVAVRVV